PGRLPVEPWGRETPRRPRPGRPGARRPGRVAGTRRPRARRRVRAPLRPAQRPALAAPQRPRRARQYRQARGRARARAPRRGRRRDARPARAVGTRAPGGTLRLRGLERWIAIVRLAAVPFAAFQVGFSSHYPSGYEADAWAATAVLAAGAIAFYALARRELDGRAATAAGIAAVAFDTAIVSVFVLIYNFEPGTPTRQLLFLPLVEAAVP